MQDFFVAVKSFKVITIIGGTIELIVSFAVHCRVTMGLWSLESSKIINFKYQLLIPETDC